MRRCRTLHIKESPIDQFSSDIIRKAAVYEAADELERYEKLDISFIGWGILCVFTLGIGFFFLKPYKEAAYAVFYREISEGRYSNPHVELEGDVTWQTYEEMNFEEPN